jgi:phage repressor protein C with HTH and peptisase S24 domain
MNESRTRHAQLGSRLKSVRSHLDETQTIFGNRFGLKRHDIANYELGRADLPSRLMSGLDELGVNLSWLLTGKGRMFRDLSLSVEGPEVVLVKRYDIRVGAGHGTYVHSEEVVGSVAFSREWIKARGLNAQNLALVDVVGDSMDKVLREGDIVLVDLSQTDIVSGKAYVIRVGDELLVKYLQHLPGDLIQMFSENSTVYPPFAIKASDLGNELVVIGRVVASAHMW